MANQASHIELPPLRECQTAWVTDFDETVCRTISERPAGGLDVNDAYERALNGLFGAEALGRYQAAGGHRNQTPAQIVAHAIPDMGPDEIPSAAEQLKRSKLELLIGQIGVKLPDGAQWPRLTTGFLEFTDHLEAVRDKLPPVTTGMVSAGHEEFIKAVYQLYDVRLPDAIITDEKIQQLAPDLSPEERAKPSSYAMELFKLFWHDKIEANRTAAVEFIGNLVYTGDDPNKDARFAANSHASFVQIIPAGEPNNWPLAARRLNISPHPSRGSDGQ